MVHIVLVLVLLPHTSKYGEKAIDHSRTETIRPYILTINLFIQLNLRFIILNYVLLERNVGLNR